jgi:hypothetical protein
LVEAKTIKGNGSPHKEPRSNAVTEAKTLGFEAIGSR